MEEEVKRAVREGSEDIALNLLLEMTIVSIREDRPVFPTIAEEPLFYRRYFYRWVKEALSEQSALDDAQAAGMEQLKRMMNQ